MNRRQRRLLVRTFGYLFAINAIFLCVYILLHPRPYPPLPALDQTPSPPYSSLKPWPHLPSLLPWHPPPRPLLRSCEAYFGHGFSQQIHLLGAGGNVGYRGWFRCHYSETLASSVCEGGRVRMDPGRIVMSRGGERLEAVIGRREEEELPKYQPGAFQIEGEKDQKEVGGRRLVDEEFLDKYVPRGEVHTHTMRLLLDSAKVVGAGELDCSEWIEEPTLLVTRFEYANLFHTITDWYSAYVSSRVTNLPQRPHLVFVDGHCKAQLEETWEALFSSVRYAKNFSNPVCFRHVILSPLGYETALFKGLHGNIDCHGAPAHILKENPDDHKTARLDEFGEMLRASFGLPVDENLLMKPSTGHNVLFVRREDYLAHPRHSGKVESRLSNEQEVFDALKNWASDHAKCKINMVNGLFAHMSMREQIKAIQEAAVVIGAHGAGLTHLVAATPKTIVLEIISSFYRRPHFALISAWKGLEYHAIILPASHANPAEVVDKLSSIMHSLGC